MVPAGRAESEGENEKPLDPHLGQGPRELGLQSGIGRPQQRVDISLLITPRT